MFRWRHSNTWWNHTEAARSVTRLPRANHFHYTHSALPSLFYQNPEAVLGWIAEPASRDFLEALWDDVGKRVLEDGLGEVLSPDGLSSESVTGETFKGAIIWLPPALEVGETIALLLAVPPTDAVPRGQQAVTDAGGRPLGVWDLLRRKEAPVARCFSLELLQFEHEPSPIPRICELSTVTGYTRTGYTCDPDSSAFLTEVVDRLDLF